MAVRPPFWKRWINSRGANEARNKAARCAVLSGDDIGQAAKLDTDHSVAFVVYIVVGYKGTNYEVVPRMALVRADTERAELEAGLPGNAKGSWIDNNDRVARGQSPSDASVLKIVDTEIWDSKDRAGTGVWFFRRDLCLSQATYDALWHLLETQFRVPDPDRTSCAILQVSGVNKQAIECERPYSGSVTRKVLDARAFQVSREVSADDVTTARFFLLETLEEVE